MLHGFKNVVGWTNLSKDNACVLTLIKPGVTGRIFFYQIFNTALVADIEVSEGVPGDLIAALDNHLERLKITQNQDEVA
jgi:hypothetical protein